MKAKLETEGLLGFDAGTRSLKAKVGDLQPPTKTQMPMEIAAGKNEPGEPVMSGSDGRAIKDR